MISIKTTNILCFSLLLSFTASIAAEGWTEWFKSKITPKNIAIAATATATGAGLFYHYWTKPRLTQTLTIIPKDDQEQTFAIPGLGLKLSNYPHVEGRIEKIPRTPFSSYRPYTHQVIDTYSGKQLLRFSPAFRLNSNMDEKPGVNIHFSGESGPIYRELGYPMFPLLYDAIEEAKLKQRYANRLHGLVTNESHTLAANEGDVIRAKLAHLQKQGIVPQGN